jgi:hypothetical protein
MKTTAEREPSMVGGYEFGEAEPLPTRLEKSLLPYRWRSTVWIVNAILILVTIGYNYLTNKHEGVTVLIALFSLQYEKSLATTWEGWLLLMIAILAMERFFNSAKTARYERQAWLGLAVLAAGLSFDELGSLHERAGFLFGPWLPGFYSFMPLIIPAVLVMLFTFHGMSRLPDRRCFWLMVGASGVLGSVFVQEYFERKIAWPFWARGLRFGVEEATELIGIFILLTVVLAPTAKSVVDLFPKRDTLIRLKPWVTTLTLLGFIPLAIVTVITIPVTDNRGIPAAWLPFVLLIISCLVAWTCAKASSVSSTRFLVAAALALFFALDQMIVFQRVTDMSIVRGDIEKIMFPCLAATLMSIPILRTRENMLCIGALLGLSLLFIPTSELLARLIVPLQALGVFWILASGLAKIESLRKGRSGISSQNAAAIPQPISGL